MLGPAGRMRRARMAAGPAARKWATPLGGGRCPGRGRFPNRGSCRSGRGRTARRSGRDAVSARGPGCEQGMVPVGEDAGGGVGGQVVVEPVGLLLAIDSIAVAVEGHDVPGADVVAVPAVAGLTGGGAEVLVVRRRLRDVVVV